MRNNSQGVEMSPYGRQGGTAGMLQAGPIVNPLPDQSPAALYRADSGDHLSKNQTGANSAAQESYCHKFCGYWSRNRVFWFHEFLTGNMLKNFFKSVGLGCLAGDSILESIVEWFQKTFTPKWLPLALRPFLTGLFLPMILFFWFDLAYLRDQSKDSDPLSDTEEAMMVISYFLTLCMFIITGVKDSGGLDTPALRQRSNDILRAKPYLRATDNFCTVCDMIKPIRAHHCEQCGICVAKYTKHSIILNRCVGAGNELLYLLMVTLFIWTVSVVLDVFVFQPLNGWLIFKIIFYFMNAHLQLQSAGEALEGLILNTVYNCTRYQVVNWESLGYLNFPDRVFYNPNNLGFWRNIGEQFVNMTCGGRFEPHQLSFLQLGKQPPYYEPMLVNWTTSLIFHPAQLPNHPNKQALAEIAYASQTHGLEASARKDSESSDSRRKERKLVNSKSTQSLKEREQGHNPRLGNSQDQFMNRMNEGMPNHHVIEDERE